MHAGSKAAQPSASCLSGGSSQRQFMPQAATRSGQPRPASAETSLLGCAGRPATSVFVSTQASRFESDPLERELVRLLRHDLRHALAHALQLREQRLGHRGGRRRCAQVMSAGERARGDTGHCQRLNSTDTRGGIERTRLAGYAKSPRLPPPSPKLFSARQSPVRAPSRPSPSAECLDSAALLGGAQVHSKALGIMGAKAEKETKKPKEDKAVKPHGQSPAGLLCRSSAPVPPQGAPGGSGQLFTLTRRRSRWAPSHRLGCSSEPPPKPAADVSAFDRDDGPPTVGLAPG